MTKSGRAERSKTLFAHAVLASIREEQLVQKHFDTDDLQTKPQVFTRYLNSILA